MINKISPISAIENKSSGTFMKFAFKSKIEDLPDTEAIDDLDTGSIIAGGYNKPYSQPPKGEIKIDV